MTLLTIDEIAAMVKLSRNYTLKVIVKQPTFPAPVLGKSKPRWDKSAVIRYLKPAQKANTEALR